MGVLKINYSDLSGAIKSAEKAAKKANDYADELEKKVCKKIADLEGGSSNNVNNADYFVKKKIEVLGTKSEKLKNFAGKLDTFYDNAKEIDKNVGSKFHDIYNQFKKDNGIKISIVSEFITYIGTKILNSNDFGRWLNNTLRSINDFFSDIWGEIKYWYKCEGGKYVVDIVISVAAIALAVVTIVTAGAGFFAVVAIIGAVIAIANAVNNIATSGAALYYNNEDPAWANRCGGMDKVSDTLRKTVDSRAADVAADVLDVTETFCDIVGIVEKLPENIDNYIEILKDGNLTTGKKWLKLGGDLLNDQFAPDFDEIKKFTVLIQNSEDISKSVKVLGNTIAQLATFKEVYDSADNIVNFKAKYLDTVCDIFGVSYDIKEFDIGIENKSGIYYNKGDTGVIDVEFGIKSNFDVNIEFTKDRSVFEKIHDVFNPKGYSTKYGIKSMTPSDDMLESVGAFGL